MLICKVICICAFAFIATADATAIVNSNPKNEEINYRLPNHTKPLLYDIKLNPHLTPDKFTFDGHVSIHIEILNRTRILTLHAKGLIIEVTATSLQNKTGLDFYIPTIYSGNERTNLLNLSFNKELSTGHYILRLKFSGVLNDKPYGFYRSSYINDAGNTVWFADTNFVATHARAAFPCWDEPAFKATFNIAIKHHRNYTAISNMPISEESGVDERDGKIWTYFEETPVMSTYLVSFLVSDFSNISNSDGTINVWSRSNVISSARFALEVAQKAAIELKRYTNSSVRVAKIDHVALPDISNKIESWGLVTYWEPTILYDEASNSVDSINSVDAIQIADNIIRQSSYQWFGNAISPSWWTNVWMNKGLAEYLKYYVTDKIYKDRRLMDLSVITNLDLILLIDSFEHAQPLNFKPAFEEIDLKVSSLTADRKAFLLLRMLSHCLSDDVFHAGLIKYLDKHKYSTAEPEDLWTALQEALDESAIPQNKFKIQDVMNTWIRQKGYPLVTITRDYETGQTKITQEYFQLYREMSTHRSTNNTNATNKKWWIPINFATRTNPDFSSTLPTYWLSPEVDELIIDDIDPLDWIIVNIQQTGFYRVNYDLISWLKIADYLQTENYVKIHALNRAQIINDAMFLMFSGKLDPMYFMDVTKYLRRETDFLVWYPVLRNLKYASKYSYVCNESGEMLKSYILDMMNNFMESIGMQDRPDDDYFTKTARYTILELACVYDHPICLSEAYDQLITYLENRTVLANRTSFHKKRWIFCNGIKQANETIWNEMLYMHTHDSEPTLYCLGYSKNQTIIEKLLNMTVSEDSPIEKEYIYRVIFSVLRGDFSNIDVVINFIINHWNKLATILDDPTILLYDISSNVVSRKQIQKMKSFLGSHGIEVPQIMELKEQNVELAEAIMIKIRLWLQLRTTPIHTAKQYIALRYVECEQSLK